MPALALLWPGDLASNRVAHFKGISYTDLSRSIAEESSPVPFKLFNKPASANVRPASPTFRDGLRAFLLFALLVFLGDRFCTYVYFFRYLGYVYLVAVCVVATRAGLRAALSCCAVLIGYVWLVYNYRVSAVPDDPSKYQQALAGTAITYPLCALVFGLAQWRVRVVGQREFDARQAAEAEQQQRRIAEAELGVSEGMRELIVRSSIDAIVGIDEEGRINMWNPNAETLLGWSKAEAMGVPATERILTGSGVNLLISGETNRSIETVLKTKSGDIPVEANVALHATANGSVRILFARDISERKQVENEIRRLNSELEDRVAMRTAELEEANRELVGFTYSVSHDLRTPLRAIVGNSRIVVEEASEGLSEQTRERLVSLERNALRMADLIENLLLFARMGQVSLNIKEVDLTEMARSLGEELQSQEPGSLEIEPEMVAHGDPDMIRMLLRNLLENAWKYVKEGEQPRVRFAAKDDGSFFVRDQGIGFDMKYVEKIWRPFERLHRDSEFPGTGIGLANARRVIERHGGRIWAESEPGQGTTICFTLAPQKAAKERQKSYAI